MILRKSKFSYPANILLVLLFIFQAFPLNGQKNDSESITSKLKNIFQGKEKENTYNEAYEGAEPDTNFTWEKYAGFLKKVSDTSKYVVLPLNEFRQTFNSNKIVIGLRHDVDVDLNLAYKFSQIESDLGFRSTYFILHTASYYLENSDNMKVHSDRIIPILKTMQNDKHFEIGWHNDLVTLQLIYNINPVTYLHEELKWLRSNGLDIYGTASHGSPYCKTYHYINYYFFDECTYPAKPTKENNVTIPKDGKTVTIIKGKLSDFDFKYEAYFLNNNKAFSDATITNGIRWNIGMLDLSQLHPGDRAVILLHPIHWHKASVHAKINWFRLPGQKSCNIDTTNHKVTVEMPYGINRDSLVAEYRISPGAYAKVNGRLQVNMKTKNDFNRPVKYKIYAENRDVQVDWTIEVISAKNTSCDFLSFKIPGSTKSSVINKSEKTITLEVSPKVNLSRLPVKFEVAGGAHVWYGNELLLNDDKKIDFSHTVQLKVVSEDGKSSCSWIIIVKKATGPVNAVLFCMPGLLRLLILIFPFI